MELEATQFISLKCASKPRMCDHPVHIRVMSMFAALATVTLETPYTTALGCYFLAPLIPGALGIGT